jgi:hypothetical protein
MGFFDKLFGKKEANSNDVTTAISGRHLPVKLIKELILVAKPDDDSKNQWWHDEGLQGAFNSCNPELQNAFKKGYADKTITGLSFKKCVIPAQHNKTEIDVAMDNISDEYSNCCYLIQSGNLKVYHPDRNECNCKVAFAVVYTAPPGKKPWIDSLSIETKIIPSEKLHIPDGV